jgi:Tfp pilus assembly PilM family ATPase
MEQGDEGLLNAARFSVLGLAREISSSIGFFEARREESISRIHVSGTIAASRAMLQLIAEELHMPCLAWDPFAKCEIALPESRRALFRQRVVTLSAAAGVALQVLQGK